MKMKFFQVKIDSIKEDGVKGSFKMYKDTGKFIFNNHKIYGNTDMLNHHMPESSVDSTINRLEDILLDVQNKYTKTKKFTRNIMVYSKGKSTWVKY